MPRYNIFTYELARMLEMNFDGQKEDGQEKGTEPGTKPSPTGTGTTSPTPKAGTPEAGKGGEQKDSESKKGAISWSDGDSVTFYYRGEQPSYLFPWDWKKVDNFYIENAIIPSSATLISDSKMKPEKIPYAYLMMIPLDENGAEYKVDGKIVVLFYMTIDPRYIKIGENSLNKGKPTIPDSKVDKKYTADLPSTSSGEFITPGFKFTILKRNTSVTIDLPIPLVMRIMDLKKGVISLSCAYDYTTGLNHYLNCFAGQHLGEYCGTDGSLLLERVVDDVGWEQTSLPKPASVLDSFLLGDSRLRTDGGLALGLPSTPEAFAIAETKTQKEGGTGTQGGVGSDKGTNAETPSSSDKSKQENVKSYEIIAPYDKLLNRLQVKNTPNGANIEEAFKLGPNNPPTKDPGTLRLANFTSFVEEASASSGSSGASAPTQVEDPGDGSTEPTPPPSPTPTPTPSPGTSGASGASGASGTSGASGLPYDGSFYETFIVPPDGFKVDGNYIPFPAAKSNTIINVVPSVMKKIIGDSVPEVFYVIDKKSIMRPAFPATNKDLKPPKGTDVRKRQYVNTHDRKWQEEYQDYIEGAYMFPYFAANQSMTLDKKGNHFIAMESGETGRVDICYSSGIGVPFVIVRDVVYRQVLPPSKEELEADAQFKKDNPEEYKKIDDPDPVPLTALVPRIISDRTGVFLFLFYVYNDYIWMKQIPQELFFALSLGTEGNQLDVEKEKEISDKIRNTYSTKICPFEITGISYYSQFNPRDYDVFQDRHGDLFLCLDQQNTYEVTPDDYNKAEYGQLTSDLKIMKSVDMGMTWKDALPEEFTFFPKRKRLKCISGYSSSCDKVVFPIGPRNVNCLYDSTTHILNLFFHMYGCIMGIRIPIESFSISMESRKKALEKLFPYVIYGTPSPSYDINFEIADLDTIIQDIKFRGIKALTDVDRRGQTDGNILIPHRLASMKTKHGTYRLFFVDSRQRNMSIISFDCGSSWYEENELLNFRG